jgi:porin
MCSAAQHLADSNTDSKFATIHAGIAMASQWLVRLFLILGSISFFAAHAEAAEPEGVVDLATPAEVSYAHELFTRPKLTGDWGGTRTALEEHGVKIDLYATQFYQGVARGGREQAFDYGGRLDYLMNVDGHKLGLWQGLFVDLHAETRFGQDVNGNSGLIAPPNLAMNFPAGRNVSAITGLKVTQALSEQFVMYAGKLNTLDAFPLRFNPAGTTGLPFLGGFQSSALVFNPAVARTVPYSAAGAGFHCCKTCNQSSASPCLTHKNGLLRALIVCLNAVSLSCPI